MLTFLKLAVARIPFCANPFPNDILDCSKLKQFADNNFNFDKILESFPKG